MNKKKMYGRKRIDEEGWKVFNTVKKKGSVRLKTVGEFALIVFTPIQKKKKKES